MIAASTNDALGISAKSIAYLLNTKNIYFVPMGQDNPIKKPNSVVADFSQIPRAVEDALNNVQTQPLLIQY